jgi:RNA polymerase sigma factor (TIGR02999 family)
LELFQPWWRRFEDSAVSIVRGEELLYARADLLVVATRAAYVLDAVIERLDLDSLAEDGIDAGSDGRAAIYCRAVNEITRILKGGQAGAADPGGVAAKLLPLVYRELRDLAAHRMSKERPGQTLSATALVHEAYLRLVGPDAETPSREWDNRGHFFAAAAEAMRRILVDNARRKQRPKHGGDLRRVDFDQDPLAEPARSEELLALDEALTRFAAEDPAKAELVKLRYFAGLTIEESAAALGISLATAKRHWAYGRAWLYSALA